MKIILPLTFLILMVILSACNTQNYAYLDNGKEKIKINIEIADDAGERAQGLMFREHLDEYSGMLFVFEDENYRSFWMKNTLIPLDMIFISESLEIVDILYAEPCKNDPCPGYPSAGKAKYVLEVNGGFTEDKQVKIGDKLVLN